MQHLYIQDYLNSFLDFSFFFCKALSLEFQRSAQAMKEKYYTKNSNKRLPT